MTNIQETRITYLAQLEERSPTLVKTSMGRQVEEINVESNTKTPSTANKVSNFVKTMFKAIANAFANFYNKVANFFHKDSRKVEQAPAKIEAPVTKAPVVEDAVVAAPVQIDPTEVKQEPEEEKPAPNTSTPWITAGKAALALGTVALGGYAAYSYFGGPANATAPSPLLLRMAPSPLLLRMAANTNQPPIESLAANSIPTDPISGICSKSDWVISEEPLPPFSSIMEKIALFARDSLDAIGTRFLNGYKWLFNSSNIDVRDIPSHIHDKQTVSQITQRTSLPTSPIFPNIPKTFNISIRDIPSHIQPPKSSLMDPHEVDMLKATRKTV